MQSSPHLPFEIILNIIDSVVPSGDPDARPIALRADDWRTVQLRQWVLVSKATSEAAARHLYGNCMYIDSHHKLMLLARTLNPPSTHEDAETGENEPYTFKYTRYITRMYLAPFGSSLDDLPAATWVFEVLSLLAPHLTSFAFNFPFYSLDADYDHLGVYPYLQNGLTRLTQLETLIYTCDDLELVRRWPGLFGNGRLWWFHFLKLRRIAMPYRNLPAAFGLISEGRSRSLPPLEQLVVPLDGDPFTYPYPSLVLDWLAPKHQSSPLKVVQVHRGFDLTKQFYFVHKLEIRNHSRVELHSINLELPLDDRELERSYLPNWQFILQKGIDGTLWSQPTVRHDDLRPELYEGKTFHLDLGVDYIQGPHLDTIEE